MGHVIFSPPIIVGAGTKQYTQGVAVIGIDASKIDLSTFTDNIIDLGSKFTPGSLRLMMSPNPKSAGAHNFEYPGGLLLSLRGTITDKEMREPAMYDKNGGPCLIVLKRDRANGLTADRANNIRSYTRNQLLRRQRTRGFQGVGHPAFRQPVRPLLCQVRLWPRHRRRRRTHRRPPHRPCRHHGFL